MKKELFLLPILFSLTGCIVYHPGPMGEYGYTYDLSMPKSEYAAAAVRYEPSGASLAYEPVPAPALVPPVYSQIPDPTPREGISPITQRRVLLPPATTIREPAGARIESSETQIITNAPVPPPTVFPLYGNDFVVGGGTNDTNNGGGGTNTNGTNGTPIGGTNTNGFGFTTNSNTDILRNQLADRTNAFREAAGANRDQFRGPAAFNTRTQATPGIVGTNSFSSPRPVNPAQESPGTAPTGGEGFTPVPAPDSVQQEQQGVKTPFTPVQPPTPPTPPTQPAPGTSPQTQPTPTTGGGVGTGGGGTVEPGTGGGAAVP